MSWRKNNRIRPIEEADLEKVLAWRNSDRIRSVMFTDQVIDMNEHRAWFESLSRENTAICMVFEFQGRPVGVVNIVRIDRYNNKCSWGFYLGEVDVPRGTGAALGFLALEHIFEVLGIRKLLAEALALNRRSVNFHKKLGFVEEGLLVGHVLKNGVYEDVVAMALFNKEWKNSKSRLEKLCWGGMVK